MSKKISIWTTAFLMIWLFGSAQALESQKNSTDYLLKRAAEYYDEGLFDDAIKYASLVLDSDPTISVAYFIMGMSQFFDDDYNAAYSTLPIYEYATHDFVLSGDEFNDIDYDCYVEAVYVLGMLERDYKKSHTMGSNWFLIIGDLMRTNRIAFDSYPEMISESYLAVAKYYHQIGESEYAVEYINDLQKMISDHPNIDLLDQSNSLDLLLQNIQGEMVQEAVP